MAADTAAKAQKRGCKLSGEHSLQGSEALQCTGGSNAEPLAHEEAEVEGGSLNQDPFSNLLLPADVDAAQASGPEHVREPPLPLLAPLAQQPLAPVTPNPPPVAVGRLLRVPLALPLPAAPVGLAHVPSVREED